MPSLVGGGDPSREELMDRQAEQQMHQQMQSSMMAGEEGMDYEDYIDQLVTHGLDEETAALIKNYLSPDLVLSYLKSAELNELKWFIRFQLMKVVDMHPPKDSYVTGADRKWLLGPGANELRPLSEYQRNLLEQAAQVAYVRAARSRQGWQQDQMNKQIAVSRTENEAEDESGGLFSL